MHTLDRMEWEILNATADDWEDLEQIYRLVPAGSALLREIADRIPGLIERGLLQARLDDSEAPPNLADRSFVWRAWFAMTPEGRSTWASSEYAAMV